MSKLVTLDEVEAYEAELKRAHAENRAPVLRDPHDVFVDSLGNTKSHLEELSLSDQTSANNALVKQRRDAINDDKKQMKVIRDNTNKLPNGEGSVQPYQAPDPNRYNGPKTADEKQAVADKVEDDYHHNRKFDDSFSDSNIPNLTDDGQVMGDSVNISLTRKMTTFSPDELVRENEANSVPVPERYRNENPPQVVQQSNPIDGTPPTPESGGFVEGYRMDGNTDVEDSFVEANFPTTVPLTEGQVAQGAVKRPEHFDPPNKPDEISDVNIAAATANLPVDATGLRGDNKAHKAAIKALGDK
jgi:hypothetical protein